MDKKLPINLFTVGICLQLPLLSIAEELSQQVTNDAIEKIEVKGRRNQPNTQLSAETEKLLAIAGIAHDPLNSVYSLPGVVYAGGDDGGEPAVRGSSPDDNAFYIDDLPAGYIFHLFGDSIFNENVVRDFKLHPAAFNSQYGNATGGVFDVQLRDPKQQDIETIVDLSFLKTGVMVEGGVTEDQAFYFSYRRSLMHLFLPEGDEEDGYTIFKAPVSDDYQGKYQWLVGSDHKVTFTVNGASDVGGINISAASEQGRVDPDSIGDLKLKTRFDSQGISWQYFGDGGKIMQLVFGHNQEKIEEFYGEGQFIDIDKEQYDLRFQYQLEWFKNHTLILGSDLQHKVFNYRFDAIPYYCTDHDQDCESKKGERIQDEDKLTNNTTAFYVNDKWYINHAWQLEVGLRAERNDYTEQSFLHHRLALNWFASDAITIGLKQGSYSRFPDIETVLKKIGNPALDSPKAQHYALSVEYQVNDLWQSSIELYYKDLKDLPRSLDEDDANVELHYSNDMSGSAKGIEWVLKRELADDWYGWASISWSKSDRTDDFTNRTTEYYLDTPLLANVVANYQYNERWDFGVRLTVRSGQKYTPIIGLRENPDYPTHFLPTYGDLNSETLPTYHRLDLQANYKTRYWGHEAQWTFALLNATNSDNFSGYYYAPDGNETLTDYNIEGEEGMGMFPSIGLKMTF
ncbi:TonB-dependent receptor [Thalassotalea hakodatensis]|uniref:TonB-dependent receptor n=1 Tax=Thalassotalea hakodatensis TaxID=3030492 RepID=UPI0025748478|nr:TonB-dependent receptor [Thalassotalea hakodatensis]